MFIKLFRVLERRYICDICGAGLKRKEHLERHKLGHSPERPHICSVCKKGFKRKEHLNLHFVIHSGDKTEVCTSNDLGSCYVYLKIEFDFVSNAQICGECGKGFYRKDHLRKHTKSHATKRLKEEMNAQAQAQKAVGVNANKVNHVTTANMTPVNITSIPVSSIASNAINTSAIKAELTTTNCSTDDILQQIQQQQQVLQLQGDCQTICLHVSPSNDSIFALKMREIKMWCFPLTIRFQQVTIQQFRFKLNYHLY